MARNTPASPKVRTPAALTPALEQLGRVLGALGHGEVTDPLALGITADEQDRFERAIAEAAARNGWFSQENVRHALTGIAHLLETQGLRHWLSGYPDLGTVDPRTVGLVLAGNLPLVGFHDLLCVLLSGHDARVKLSAQDAVLLPAVVDLLARFEPQITERVAFTQEPLGQVDAVIATGSNNTARYFEHYFKHLPHIIRRNRVSVAVLDGSETEAELAALGEDVFRYFGLGCRNVAKLYVPQDFDLDRFFRAIFPWQHIAGHNKYANNLDYHRALWLLDGADLLENGFLLLKEDSALASPVGSLYYERYTDRLEVDRVLAERAHEVQCIVGHGQVPFGRSQFPGPADYADGLDTLAFLQGLGQGTNS
ncbi:MAG TPA: acyl-CoA reductase [Flavobacteriales bacterium]|nr:acyl-CoA reductase [Flavobacteriales bacterium]